MAESICEKSTSANRSTVKVSVKASGRIFASRLSTAHSPARICPHVWPLVAKEADGVQGEKAGVLLTAVGDARIHPRDARLHVLKHVRVIRAVEDLLPDAADRFAQQRSLGIKVIIDRAHRYAAGRGDQADADRGPPLLPDQLPAGFQDLLFGCDRCVHTSTST